MEQLIHRAPSRSLGRVWVCVTMTVPGGLFEVDHGSKR